MLPTKENPDEGMLRQVAHGAFAEEPARWARKFVDERWIEIRAVAEMTLEMERLTGVGQIDFELAQLAIAASNGVAGAIEELSQALSLRPELAGQAFSLQKILGR